jgi:hypothetical protein
MSDKNGMSLLCSTRFFVAAILLVWTTSPSLAQDPPLPPPPDAPFKLPPAGPQNLQNGAAGAGGGNRAQQQFPRPASASTAAVSQRAFAPSMIGDGFAGNSTVFTNYEGQEGHDDPSHFALISPGLGGGVGQIKLMEAGSPIPRDRVMLNYSYFSGVPIGTGNIYVNRFTPGFEKTFFEGNSSIEVRVPMAITAASTFNHDDISSIDSTDYQFGNVTTFLKTLLYRDDTFALSAGGGLVLPTAANTVMLSEFRGRFHNDLVIRNESIHLMPFLGGTYTPNDRFFSQSIVQVDFSANGNPVSVESISPQFPFGEAGPLKRIGSLNDATFLYASLATGYWLHRAAVGSARITGLAPIAELHYNRSLQPTDTVTIPDSGFTYYLRGQTIGSKDSDIEAINAVIGLTMLADDNKSLTAAYTVPLGGGADKQFNGEFRLLFNWYFGGPTNRQTRVQF